MDPFQAGFDETGFAMVARAGLQPWLQFHRKFAEEVIPGLPSLQFGFIDSSHLFNLTMAESVLMDEKLDVGGVLAFHDSWMPSLQKFLRYVLGNRAYAVLRDFDSDPALPRPQVGWARRTWSHFARRLPHGQRILAPEVLLPWKEFGLSNLVFLRKVAPGTRDWRFHQSF